MTLTIGLALIFAAQGSVATDPALATKAAPTETAFSELEEGRIDAAIARLEMLRDTGEADAAALINLGAAYERAGRAEDAREAYSQAARADEYELELADGSWRSSRDIARAAVERMDSSALALR